MTHFNNSESHCRSSAVPQQDSGIRRGDPPLASVRSSRLPSLLLIWCTTQLDSKTERNTTVMRTSAATAWWKSCLSLQTSTSGSYGLDILMIFW